MISDYVDSRQNIRSICPLVDPIDCNETDFIEDNAINLMRIAINTGTETQTLSIEDTISKYYGNLDGTSYCGDRTYVLIHEPDWLTLDNGVLTITSIS